MAIESSAKLDLPGLIARTQAVCSASPLFPWDPEMPSIEVMKETGWVLRKRGPEWLVLYELEHFDALVGIGSRRKLDTAATAWNESVAVVLEVLQTKGEGSRAKYGTVFYYDLDRAIRTRIGEAHLTRVCMDWGIRLVEPRGVFDPIDPSFDMTQMLSGFNAERNAELVVARTQHAKISLHEHGHAGFSRRSVNPVLAVHPETGQLSWDHEVVAAVRLVARLRGEGAPWPVIGDEVGSLIPSYVLRDMTDAERKAHNELLVQRNREAVPLKYLPSGAPSPLYRPEMISDLLHPELGLRTILLRPVRARRQREDLGEQFAEGEIALDERQLRRSLMVDGVYIRAVRDPSASNSVHTRYRLSSVDLGPVDLGPGGEPVGVLSAAEFDVVWPEKKFAYSQQGQAGYGYLKGVFRVVNLPDRSYAHHHGWMDLSEGRFGFHSGLYGGGKVRKQGYMVRYQPSDTARVGYTTVAVMDRAALYASIADAMEEALDQPEVHRLVGDSGWVARSWRRRHGAEVLDQRLEVAEALLRQAVDDWSQLLSPERRTALEEVAERREAEVVRLRQERAKAKPDDDPSTAVSGLWLVGRSVDLLAVLRSGQVFGQDATLAIQAAFRSVLTDGEVEVDLDAGVVRWRAVLRLPSSESDGPDLERPIGGSVAYSTRDTWLRPSTERLWWGLATGESGRVDEMPIPLEGVPKGARQAVQQRLALRLSYEASRHGVPLRSRAAELLVYSTSWDVARAGVEVLRGAPAAQDDDLRAFVRDVVVDREPVRLRTSHVSTNSGEPWRVYSRVWARLRQEWDRPAG